MNSEVWIVEILEVNAASESYSRRERESEVRLNKHVQLAVTDDRSSECR